jgi:hypothetical protein
MTRTELVEQSRKVRVRHQQREAWEEAENVGDPSNLCASVEWGLDALAATAVARGEDKKGRRGASE